MGGGLAGVEGVGGGLGRGGGGWWSLDLLSPTLPLSLKSNQKFEGVGGGRMSTPSTPKWVAIIKFSQMFDHCLIKTILHVTTYLNVHCFAHILKSIRERSFLTNLKN